MKKYNGFDLKEEDFKKSSKVEDQILDVVEGESLSFFKDAWIRLRQNKAAMFGLTVIVIFTLLAIFVPYFGRDIILEQNPDIKYLPPKIPGLSWLPFFDGVSNGIDRYAAAGESGFYIFGTDGLGRNMWYLVWKGVRVSLFIAFLAAIIDLMVGILYGGVSGYYGGKVDMVMQRIIEIISAIPSTVIAILLVVILEPGIVPIAIALMLTSWIGMSRITRAQVMRNKDQEFVLAAKTLGAKDGRVIKKHLFPNVIGQLVVVTMFSIPNAIFYESFLSYIGVGIVYPSISLGALISDGQTQLLTNPHLLFVPALILSLIMLAFNFLANGLRDALDPKMRGK